MKNAAAISAQLVDVRNVQTHKCVRLTIEVPAEQAMQVMAAFGWPTQANPVPVAVARLVSGDIAPEREGADSAPPTEAPSRASKNRLAQQAGRLCADEMFQKFVALRDVDEACESHAIQYVRRYCSVATRADIIVGTEAGTLWDVLVGEFEAWRRCIA